MSSTPVDSGLYAFHKANIHERRFVAKVCAALPILILFAYFAVLAYGLLRSPVTLLVTCAIMNASTWLWITSTAILGIAGASFAKEALQRAESSRQRSRPAVTQGEVDMLDRVVHLIVLPNFKEDEEMLNETMQSLSEADESESFCIILAMEERETDSILKGERIKNRFRGSFGGITVTVHPADLKQAHLDGSEDHEVPGKASNLKWAVPQGFAEFQKSGRINSLNSVILTVADADCIFHPSYFSAVTREFNMLREFPGNDHLWTMYQAPQLPYRNYYDAAACCRIWAYISSTYEFGGVTSLDCGGTHMTFSGYSLPLQLALEAGAWDGDIIAEDHHAFLKCFLYSALASAETSSSCAACIPQLKVKPVYLPVKSTSVAAGSYWRTCIDRWWQAKRHAQGASELSYVTLAAFDALLTLPWKSQCFAFYWQVSKIIMRLFCMHLLPTCQGVGLLAVSAVWLYHGRHHPLCHTNASLADVFMGNYPASHYAVCGFAGAWVMIWPMVILTALVIVSNYLFLKVVFVREKSAGRAEGVWHAQDGGLPRHGLPQGLTAFLQTTFDCTFLLSILMIPYGFFANAAAYIDIAIYGNRVKYITASKPPTRTSYGSCGESRDQRGDIASASSGNSSTSYSETHSDTRSERSWSEMGDDPMTLSP